MKFYILTPDHKIAEVGFAEYAEFQLRDGHIIDRTETPLHVISTVFVGSPFWFETMTFYNEGGEMGEPTGDQWRFPTWRDAKAGHRAIVRLTRMAEANAAEMAKVAYNRGTV